MATRMVLAVGEVEQAVTVTPPRPPQVEMAVDRFYKEQPTEIALVVEAQREATWVPTLVVMLSTAGAEAEVAPIQTQLMLAREAHHSMPLEAAEVVARLAAVIQMAVLVEIGEGIPQAEEVRLV